MATRHARSFGCSARCFEMPDVCCSYTAGSNRTPIDASLTRRSELDFIRRPIAGTIITQHVMRDRETRDNLHGLKETVDQAEKPPKHFVVARPCPSTASKVYMYPIVPHSPLEVKDAFKVLRTLSEKIKAALDELHGHGFTHNDVRLPNICFNDQLDAVLIDLDRACEGRTSLVTIIDSCMYDRPRGAGPDFCLDFMQLGWLLAWVLHPQGNYHQRTWEDLPQSIRNDRFISDLINCGQYSQTKLLESTEIRDTDMFESVLANRSHDH